MIIVIVVIYGHRWSISIYELHCDDSVETHMRDTDDSLAWTSFIVNNHTVQEVWIWMVLSSSSWMNAYPCLSFIVSFQKEHTMKSMLVHLVVFKYHSAVWLNTNTGDPLNEHDAGSKTWPWVRYLPEERPTPAGRWRGWWFQRDAGIVIA